MLGIYTRLSKDDPESNSPDNQLREGLKFFKKNENLYKTYHHYDEGIGVSGGLSINERPALKRLVDDIQSGRINAVWMRNQDRLERNTLTFHLFANIATSNSIDVYFGDNPKVDYNNPDSILQGSLMSAFNSYKRQKQGYDTIRTLKDNMREGKIHAVIPFGFKRDDDRKMITDEKEAETVRNIFKWSLEGKGYKRIADKLNELKIKTRYAGLEKGGVYKHKNKKTGVVTIRNKKDAVWTKASVRVIIKNIVYKGIRKTKSGEEYPIEHIIEPYLFDKVNRNLVNNMTGGVKKISHQYLLNKINTCGVCGLEFNGRVVSVGANYKYYQCVTKRNGKESCGNLALRMEILDQIVWDVYFKNKTILSLLDNEYNFGLLATENYKFHIEIQSHKKRIDEIIARKKEVVNLVLDKTFKPSDVQETMEELDNERNDLENLIHDKTDLMNEISSNIQELLLGDVEFNNIGDIIEFEDKQSMIQKYIKNITITKVDKNDIFAQVDFKAPNIDSDFIVVDRLYNWYAEPLRDRIINFDGEVIKDTEIIEQIQAYNIKRVKKPLLPNIKFYDPYTHTIKEIKAEK